MGSRVLLLRKGCLLIKWDCCKIKYNNASDTDLWIMYIDYLNCDDMISPGLCQATITILSSVQKGGWVGGIYDDKVIYVYSSSQSAKTYQA